MPTTTRPSNTIALMVPWLLVVVDGQELIVDSAVKPTLTESWDLSQAAAGALGSAVFLGMRIGAIAAGRLSDSRGRQRAVMWSTMPFTVATGLRGVLDSPFLFGPPRLIAGLSLGVTPTAALGTESWHWMSCIPIGCLIALAPLTLRLIPESVDRQLPAADRAKAQWPTAGFGALLRLARRRRGLRVRSRRRHRGGRRRPVRAHPPGSRAPRT